MGSIILKGINDPWLPPVEIRKLGDFVLTNPRYFYPLTRYVKQTDLREAAQLKDIDGYLEKQLEPILMETVHLDMIKFGSLTTEFKALIIRFTKYDIDKSGNPRGDLLEYICYCKGPFYEPVNLDRVMKLRKCVVLGESGRIKCGNHDLDLGFKNSASDLAELLECKFNLSNFLAGDNRASRKLDYMGCVNKLVEDIFTYGRVALPTMQMSSIAEEEIPSKLGHSLRFTISTR